MNDEIKSTQLLVRLSEEELKQIKKNAKVCGQTVSAYIRESALNLCVVPIDLDIVTKNTEEIAAYRNAITQLIFTIKKNGNYTPLDLEYILEKTKELVNCQKKFLQRYEEHIELDEKRVGKTVRNIVNRRISKSSTKQ